MARTSWKRQRCAARLSSSAYCASTPTTGGYDTIVYHAIFRIAMKYPGEEDARALLDYLRTEKGIDVDAYWAQYRQNSAPSKE